MPSASPERRLAEYRRKRDFARSPEPTGTAEERENDSGSLRFVVQKHQARHLHFDLRLELDGVMKSWAVPKGPSTDPSAKRLAMQVEDHPIEYNDFEGTIPPGQYGGGTVMLWDVGTYTPEGADGEDEAVMRQRYRKGDVKIAFHGQRLRGSYALVRMKPREPEAKPAWLLIKHRDRYASATDMVAKHTTSVTTGRTIEEIAADEGSDVWESNREAAREDPAREKPARAEPAREKPTRGKRARKEPTRRKRATTATADALTAATASLKPMLATIGDRIPTGSGWTFEPKYDGIRVLAYCTRDEVGLITRNGHDKSRQFPEITEALRKVASAARRSLVLDGEIVAMVDGKPARFQVLQRRMHLTRDELIEGLRESSPVAIAVFDLLLDGDDVLLREPWTVRRERLERRIGKRVSNLVLLAPSSTGDGEKLLEEARAGGWEGLIAKRTDARYEPGKRPRWWLKLKAEHRQEFVVGGWTEPRQSRQHLGAILLGYFNEAGELVYAGHTGGGFGHSSLAEMYRLLKALERRTSPFTATPKTNERAHWAEPKVVVEVRFNEWTADGKLRQPTFLGVRTDKPASAIRREPKSVQDKEPARRKPSSARKPPAKRARKRA